MRAVIQQGGVKTVMQFQVLCLVVSRPIGGFSYNRETLRIKVSGVFVAEGFDIAQRNVNGSFGSITRHSFHQSAKPSCNANIVIYRSCIGVQVVVGDEHLRHRLVKLIACGRIGLFEPQLLFRNYARRFIEILRQIVLNLRRQAAIRIRHSIITGVLS